MELQAAFLMEAGLTQPGAGGFAMFMLKCNHGMVEPKQETPTDNLALQLGELIGKLPS